MTESVRHVTASAGFTEDQILSVGVGVPGIASKETGEIIKCPNMGWNHVPFREEWIRLLNKPLFIDNDANVAALGEQWLGGGKGFGFGGPVLGDAVCHLDPALGGVAAGEDKD